MFGKPKSLPFSDWPIQDQHLWMSAISSGGFMEKRGKAAHWADETKNQARKSYAKWLRFLKERGELGDVMNPASRITEARLRAYVSWMEADDLGSVTIAARVRDLVEVLRVMEPQANLKLVVTLAHSLKQRATPRRQKHQRIVNSGEALKKILERIRNIDRYQYQSPLVRAGAYRDLVVFAFLAARPIRRKNLASLQLGRHVMRQENGIYVCRLSAAETKERLPFEFTLPVEISQCLDHYIASERGVLLRGGKSDALWISNRGTPMRSFTIYYNVKKLGREVLDVDITPHLLRDSLATSFAIEDPEHMLAASRVLGHSGLETTIRHYNQANMLGASRILEEAIAEAKAMEPP